MSKLAAFNRFVNENSRDERESRLRSLGMAPQKPTEARWSDFRRDWNSNPIIKQALTTINMETRKLGLKHLRGLTSDDEFIENIQNYNYEDVMVWDPVDDPFVVFGVKWINTWLV